MYDNELRIFQRSNESIWTDEHVSKSLLDAHLDESYDAASRKIDRRMDTINWINKNLDSDSKILDLGCGPGLYAYELGKLGHNVLGVDFNKESINYAQNHKSIKDVVQYKYCDYLTESFKRKFNTAIMIFCDFGALIPCEQKILLHKIHDLLNDNGIFIFDVFGLHETKNITEKKDWFISKGNDFWSNEPYFMMEERKYFGKETALGTRHYLVNQMDGKIKEFIMWDQYYDEQSIEILLSENGFEIKEINKNIVKYKEETLFILAKRKG